MEQSKIQLDNGIIKVWIDLEDGMNVCKLMYGDQIVIDTDENRKAQGATYGMPILYPTPGRTRDNRLLFGKKEYQAFMHGLIRKHPFSLLDGESDNRKITAYLDWNEREKQYLCYPFRHRLSITVELQKNSLLYSYKVENKGEEQMAYGFALHPFFLNTERKAYVSTTAEYAMESDEHLLPTGKLLSTKGHPEYDIKKPRKVTELSLDTVFYKIHNPMAVIDYPEFQITLETSEEFQHVVIYTPEGYPYFCVEPQTSSADTFHLYEKGFHKESGLQFVLPGEKKQGNIRFSFIDQNSTR